jgi:hypothetical protein
MNVSRKDGIGLNCNKFVSLLERSMSKQRCKITTSVVYHYEPLIDSAPSVSSSANHVSQSGSAADSFSKKFIWTRIATTAATAACAAATAAF